MTSGLRVIITFRASSLFLHFRLTEPSRLGKHVSGDFGRDSPQRCSIPRTGTATTCISPLLSDGSYGIKGGRGARTLRVSYGMLHARTQGQGGECVMAISPARDDIIQDITSYFQLGTVLPIYLHMRSFELHCNSESEGCTTCQSQQEGECN